MEKSWALQRLLGSVCPFPSMVGRGAGVPLEAPGGALVDQLEQPMTEGDRGRAVGPILGFGCEEGLSS